MKAPLFTIFAIFFFVLLSCKESAIVVAPDGNDAANGNHAHPLASLQKAIEMSRENGTKNIILREGKYYDVSVQLNRIDSGLTISGENNKVIIYGGKVLNGWKKEGDWLVADVPGTKNRSVDFRLFMVNDSVRSRARFPETGAFTHLSKWDHEWMSTQGGWSKIPTEEELTTLLYSPQDLGTSINVDNAELTVFHMWDDSYVGVKSIDTINHKLTFSFPATHPAGSFSGWGVEKARKYIVWNTREGMNKPGQWYLDRSTERLYYWPYPWETSVTLQAIIPTVHQVISLQKGSKEIKFENLQICGSGAPISNTGYGTGEIEGAIQAFDVSEIIFSHISVKNVSGWAIKVSGEEISIRDCEFSNTYAGGVSYEGKNIRLERSGIHDVGTLYNGAVGISGGGENNLVSHCELYNLPYAGVNGLGSKSVAEYNLIYNFKTILEDGGAFYCYGGDSTVYRNNAVLDTINNHREGWTYYFDELSKNCIIENNLAVNTIKPVHNHMANGLTIRNNLFIDQHKQVLANPLCSNVHFTGNTFVADSILFENPTGEPLAKKKETYNPIFQKFYEANGVIEFQENTFYSNAVNLAVLHMYNTNRIVKINLSNNTLIAEPAVRKAFRVKFPEDWKNVGFRNNVAEVFRNMTSEY